MSSDAPEMPHSRIARLLADDTMKYAVGDEVTLKNYVSAVIADLNRSRALSMVDDCAALLAGSDAARQYVLEPYPMADGERVKTLRFWTPADLVELANLRLMVADSEIIPDPDGPQVARTKALRAVGILTEVAERIVADHGSQIDDVDWWISEVSS